jgi:hypothetical protein
VKPHRDPESEKLDAGVSPNISADGGWVKPAWAVPDDEPPRKAPDLMEEEPR